jgi:hypothetical protein
MGGPLARLQFATLWEPAISRAILGLQLLVPAAAAKRRLPCFQGRSPDTDGDPEAPLTLGRVRNAVADESGAANDSDLVGHTRGGGSRVACGKQAAGTSDFKGR